MLRFNRMESILFSWKPIWSGMILLLSKMIVSVADDRVLSDPSLQSFSYHERLMYTTFWIFLFFSIFARSEYFLALWHTSVFGFPKSAYISFSRIWLSTISDAHAFLDFNWFLLFQVFKNTWCNIIAVILRTHTYSLHWLNFFPRPFSTSGAHWIIFSGTSALYW